VSANPGQSILLTTSSSDISLITTFGMTVSDYDTLLGSAIFGPFRMTVSDYDTLLGSAIFGPFK
jgi:hypothetical protein